MLTDEKIIAIIKDSKLQDKFPPLHAIQKTLYTPPKTTGGCSKCQRNRLVKSTASIQNVLRPPIPLSIQNAIKAVKKYIKNMDNATRTEFKNAIGVSDLRFTLTDIDGRVKEFRY